MNFKLIPSDKLISIDDKALDIVRADMSWIPSNVHAVHWDSANSIGEVQYNNGDSNTPINELGIYSKVEETFNEELALMQKEEEEFAKTIDWTDGLRDRRDRLLYECDWIVIRAKERGTNIPAAWKTYRQALRDLPDAVEQTHHKMMMLNDHHQFWPTKPSS